MSKCRLTSSLLAFDWCSCSVSWQQMEAMTLWEKNVAWSKEKGNRKATKDYIKLFSLVKFISYFLLERSFYCKWFQEFFQWGATSYCSALGRTLIVFFPIILGNIIWALRTLRFCVILIIEHWISVVLVFVWIIFSLCLWNALSVLA